MRDSEIINTSVQVANAAAGRVTRHSQDTAIHLAARLKAIEQRLTAIETLLLDTNRKAQNHIIPPAPRKRAIHPVAQALKNAKPEPMARLRPAQDKVVSGSDQERLNITFPTKHNFDIGD